MRPEPRRDYSEDMPRTFMNMRRLRTRWLLPVLGGSVVLAVGALAVLAVSTLRQHRALSGQALRDMTALAASSFAYRLFGNIANPSVTLVESLGSGEGDAPVDARRFQALVDSAVACDCMAAVPAQLVVVGDDKEHAVWAWQVHGRPVVPDVEREVVLRALVNGPIAADMPGAPPLYLRAGGPTTAPWLLIVVPRRDASGRRAGFVAYEPDLDALRATSIERLFDGLPLLIPPSLTGIRSNALLAQLTVGDDRGRTLYRSSPQYQGVLVTMPLSPRDSGISVGLTLSPEAAAGLFGKVRTGAPRWVEIVLPLLALGLAGSVVLALWRAEQLSRLRATFAASVTHELRTPLTQILLYAESMSLGRMQSPVERQTATRVILREARRLVELVENVLHFSRAEQRILRLSPGPFSLSTVARDVLERMGKSLGPEGERLVLEAHEEQEASVDPAAFDLVLRNVLDNSLKYSPAGSAIVVRVIHGVAGPEVVVDDAGPGIPLRDRKRVFRPFARLDAGHRAHPTGSGIGLAVVHDLMDAMDGRVLLEESPFGGLRVRLGLPPVTGARAAS